MESAQCPRSLTDHFEEPTQGIAGNRLKDTPKSLTDAWLADVIWFGPATAKGSGARYEVGSCMPVIVPSSSRGNQSRARPPMDIPRQATKHRSLMALTWRSHGP
jgi:hypothetical protein